MKLSTQLKTPLGWVRLETNGEALTGLAFTKEKLGVSDPHPVLELAKKQLTSYFSGEEKPFKIRLCFEGTPFQQSVWEALLEIPYGETRTYSDMAQLIGRPRAVRAVGTAVGKNPLPIFIPCHRVIGSGGALGGFTGGIDKKIFMLDLESQAVSASGPFAAAASNSYI